MANDIYKRIIQTMKDCGAIAKDSYNPQQKYKYRGIDAVMNALNPAMSKNGIFVVPEVIDVKREERESRQGATLIYSTVTVKYTFFCEDSSSVTAVVAGEGMDSGDKSINKAMSAAYKYACFQVFCIPTEEMHDSEEDSPAVKAKEDKPKPATVDRETLLRLQALLLNRTDKFTPEYVCKWGKVEKLDDLTQRQAEAAIRSLETVDNQAQTQEKNK